MSDYEGLFSKLADYRARYIQDNGDIPRVYVAESFDEYLKIIGMAMRNNCLTKPSVPVKAEIKEMGLFSLRTRVEYDHHAPEYLEKLKKYNEEMKEQLETIAKGDFYFLGMKILSKETNEPTP